VRVLIIVILSYVLRQHLHQLLANSFCLCQIVVAQGRVNALGLQGLQDPLQQVIVELSSFVYE
jgi:hypothetical protein